MNKSTLQGIVRHVLTTIGGALVAKGTIDEGMVSEGVGALVAAAGLIWSIWDKRNRGSSDAGNLPTIGIALAAILLVGCAGNSPRMIAYKSLASVGYGVDAAMKSYADLVVAGKLSEATIQDVEDKHERYRIAYAAAIDAAQFDTSAPATQEIQDLAFTVTDAIARILESSGGERAPPDENSAD